MTVVYILAFISIRTSKTEGLASFKGSGMAQADLSFMPHNLGSFIMPLEAIHDQRMYYVVLPLGFPREYQKRCTNCTDVLDMLGVSSFGR